MYPHNYQTPLLPTKMLSDSVLPADIRPAAVMPGAVQPRHVLLTGATGFLGAYLLRTLLDETEADVYCLARAASGDALTRIRQNLERYGLWQSSLSERIHAIRGDLLQAGLGLTAGEYDLMSKKLDSIYHAGANVNWIVPYRALRQANVIGTRELIRLECKGQPKRFHFISSLSVGYAVGGPASVSEDDDMLPFINRLPLPYAQSKCVAEALVREAAARGLNACIYRPGLVGGDSRTGASNLCDLVAALMKGCIQMGAAPDLDWMFDVLPVDYVARAIVRLPRLSVPGLQNFHLSHARPRHWRECVLWMNLFGYPVTLLPYQAWRELLERDAASPDHALHRLRRLFLRPQLDGASIPELYQEGRRSAPDCARTRQAEAALGLSCPPLNTELLDRYFRYYVEQEFLPEPQRRRNTYHGGTETRRYTEEKRRYSNAQDAEDAAWLSRNQKNKAIWSAAALGCGESSLQTGEKSNKRKSSDCAALFEKADFFQALLRRHFGDKSLRVRDATLLTSGSDHSIIGELTSWRQRQRTGLFHYRLTLAESNARRKLDLMLKAKPSDEAVIEVAESVAAVADPLLAQVLHGFRDRIGTKGGHLRELAIYEEADERLRQNIPICYGTWRDDAHEEWGLALEYLEDMALMDASDDPGAWSPAHIEAAIIGLAEIHASWHGRETELRERPWIGHIASVKSMVEMTPLWRALADHAAPYFEEWAGAAIVETHRALVESISEWWQPLESGPCMLIHNDFNPRNVALRRDGDGFRLCAYDWELATVGAPQHDLAEFLCFVLQPDVSEEELNHYLEMHRTALSSITGHSISAAAWREGFHSALADLLINRLAFYAMIHRVRPQQFLPRVVQTWQRLNFMNVDPVDGFNRVTFFSYSSSVKVAESASCISRIAS